MSIKYNPPSWKYQPKIGGPGRINRHIYVSLECADVVRWDQAAASPSGIRLRDVLADYGLPGLPVEIRSRYNLEADFRLIQGWRGRMSGLWRRVRTASRDAEIRCLIDLGNTFQSVADLYHLAKSSVHYIYHRTIEQAASLTA